MVTTAYNNIFEWPLGIWHCSIPQRHNGEIANLIYYCILNTLRRIFHYESLNRVRFEVYVVIVEWITMKNILYDVWNMPYTLLRNLSTIIFPPLLGQCDFSLLWAVTSKLIKLLKCSFAFVMLKFIFYS